MVEVNREHVLEAARRIAGSVVRTPLAAASIRGRSVWLKCECLQTGGAFKLRGASNRLLALSEEERSRGVVAFSSGNHAQGVAIAAHRLGIKATIVMPSDAPALKVEGTRANGAQIIFYDRMTESREAIAAEIAASSGAIVVPSFDDPWIVAGQAKAIPDASPPPPTGTAITGGSPPSSSMISRPTVPWPATIHGSSKLGTTIAPLLAAISAAIASRLSVMRS